MAPTAWALAVEQFILEKKNKEDKNSRFYQDVLSKIHDGSFRRDVPDESKAWADGLSAAVNDLENDSRTRSKGRRFVERIGRVCAGFNQYAGACDVMIQAGPAAAQLIYGGARLLLQLAQKIQECYETVVDILEDISSHIQCFHAFAQAYNASEHVQKQLVKSYKLIINFWLKASKLLTGHTLTKLFTRNSQLSREWQKYCGDLHRCKDQVCLAVEAAKADLRHEKSLLDQAQAKENERRDTMNAVVNWIGGDDDDRKLSPRRTINEKMAMRYGNSCAWISENRPFQSWKQANKTASLWISSRPGTGKSVLASHIVRLLQDDSKKVVSYFFSFSDPTQKRSITALKSLALQLLATYQSVPDSVLRIFSAEAKDRCSKLDNVETAIQLLMALLKQISRVHIIVDGLDECHDRSLLLHFLSRVIDTKTHGIVKWLLTSRPEKEFRDCLVAHGVPELEIPAENLNRDVREFLQDGIRNRLGIECPIYIEHWVCEADGNFLWARLTLSILHGEGFTCEAEIDEALKQFPKGLEGCYERSLCQLVQGKKEAEWKLAQNVFTLMVAAVQPLRLSEISHAIAAIGASTAGPSEDDFNPRRVPRLALIETLCSGLVEFERSTQDAQNDPVLKFAHKSVRDFLVSDPTSLGVTHDIADFFVTEQDAQLRIGKACLHYLSFARYHVPQDTSAIMRAGPHAFLRYAAAFWQHHLSDAPHSRDLYNDILAFIRSPGFWNCLQVQAHTVPHIFAKYFEMAPNMFDYSLDDDRRKEVLDVAYGSPLPLWLDETTYGHEGQEIVEEVQKFVRQWHSVLESHPAAFSQCVMDSAWEARFASRADWKSSRLVSHSLSPPADSPASDLHGAEFIAIRSYDGSSRLRIQLGSRTDSLSLFDWILNLEQDATSLVRQVSSALLATGRPDKSNVHVIGQMDGRSVSSLNLETLTVSVCTADGADAITYPPGQSPSEPWHIRSILSNFETSTTAVYCTLDPPKAERRMQDHDSGFYDEDESDAHSFSTEDEDSDPEDRTDESSPDEDKPTQGMLLVRPNAAPVWSFWSRKNGLDDIRCAIGHNRSVAVWSTTDAEACVVNLATGQMKNTYLPEPVASQECISPMAEHREFHFSEDETILYYLKYTATENDFGVTQSIMISALNFAEEEAQPVLTRIGAPCSINYISAGRLKWPCILRCWTSEYLYLALPDLSCDPKVVRLRLSNLSDDGTPQFNTLKDPIYFPSNTIERKPKIFAFDKEGADEMQLVLAADSHPANHSSEAPVSPPSVIVWKLNNGTDWRPWDEKQDTCLERYKLTDETCSRLRGNFVDPTQRFLVPIRSGLDWTKKAFVACL